MAHLLLLSFTLILFYRNLVFTLPQSYSKTASIRFLCCDKKTVQLEKANITQLLPTASPTFAQITTGVVTVPIECFHFFEIQDLIKMHTPPPEYHSRLFKAWASSPGYMKTFSLQYTAVYFSEVLELLGPPVLAFTNIV